MFLTSWAIAGRTALLGLLGYLILVLFLRLSGKRTLSQLDPFDFVITTALGSVLAQATLSRDVTLAQATVAFATFIALQFVVTWLTAHHRLVRDLIKGKPCLLFYRGNYLRENMRREHVAEIELLAAMRNAGVATMDAVEAIVLEASSGLNVIRRGDGRGLSTLSDVDSDSDRG